MNCISPGVIGFGYERTYISAVIDAKDWFRSHVLFAALQHVSATL